MQNYETIEMSPLKLERKEDRWTFWKLIYAVLTGTLLLSYLYVMLTYKENAIFVGGVYSLPVFLWVLRLISVGMTLLLGKVWKDRGFLILMAYVLLMIVRILLENSIRLFALSVSESLLCGMWVYITCYGIARVLSFRQIKQFIAVCVAAWTIGLTVFSCIGLYAYWTDQRILNLTKTAYFGVETVHGRLTLCYYFNPSAATVSLSMVITTIAFLSVKRKWIKAAYGIAWIILMIILSLSTTRTANVTAGISLGTIAGIEILNCFYKKRNEKTGRGKVILVWLGAILTTGIILVVVMVGLMRIIPIINAVKTRGGMITVALAEEANSIWAVDSRSYMDLGLNDRVNGWMVILSYMKNSPYLFLTGTSIFFPMEGTGVIKQHAHCRMLMTLLESGIPGLLLYILFYVYIIRCSLRLMKSSHWPVWVRLLPALVASLVMGDLVECMTWLQAGNLPILPYLMVACGIISTYGSRKEVTL